MTNEFPTLFDRVRAGCLGKHRSKLGYKDTAQKIFAARRFTLGDDMSEFLGDLASAAFQSKSMEGRLQAIEAMRMGARLPHPLTWVEYDLRKCMMSTRKYGGPVVRSPGFLGPSHADEMPKHEGWLIEQHPKIETAFRANIYIHSDKWDEQGFDTWWFPWQYCWVSDDAVLPWRSAQLFGEHGKKVSEIIVGMIGYHSPHVGVDMPEWLMRHGMENPQTLQYTADLLREWTGTVRRMWAFLATINDLPVKVTEVKPWKGYMAGRNYRKFLEHRTITLTVPTTRYRRLAQRVVAIARRKAHQVRGHWRKDWRNPFSPLCEHILVAHEEHIECSVCKGRRVWVTEHQRGDANLGFVTHDYKVEHKMESHDAPD